MKPRNKNYASNAITEMLGGKNIEPAVQEVDCNLLMEGLIGEIKKYVVISDHSALATALWIINTWCYESFDRCPLLLINAPERECGKTQLLKVVEKLAFRPMETANITLAALFRLISNHKPTLLIDEADTFMEGKIEMAGVVNKGYERGGFVLRMESDGKQLIECAYRVYGPKALAGIMLERHLPDATMSRGIQIPLKRKTKDDTVQRLRSADPKIFLSLKSRILRLVLDQKEVLAKGWSDMPEALSDRQQDNWESLLTIAHCFGEEWYEKACEAALQNSGETSPPKSSSNQLLEDIREVLSGYKERYIPSADLLELLNENMDMDWAHYNRGQPITARQISRHLGGYGIKPKTVRMKADYTPKGYEVREFEDAFNRYLPERIDEPTQEEKTPPRIGKPPIPNF
jgi:putative DNA primase/helicase